MENTDIDDAKLYALIGARLAERRLANEKSQAWVAERIGLLRTSITNIEKGRQKAPLHVIYALCDALEVDPRDIIPSLSEVRRPTPQELFFDRNWLESDAPKAAEFLRQVIGDSMESDS